MSAEDFPKVHAAYTKYVEELTVAPTNPTQLIRFCQKDGIDGITWSKCSKFFKSLDKPAGHHKSTSGPLLKKRSSVPDIDTSSVSPMIVVTPAEPVHKRTQSAFSPRTRSKLLSQNNNSDIMNGNIGSKFTDFTDLREEDDDQKVPSTPPKVKRASSLKRISLTPPGIKKSTSFKVLPVEDNGNEVAPKRQRISVIKKHSLMSKPWNRTKPPLWPKTRMPMSYELKHWLHTHKFDKFETKLHHFGIETMGDLRLLTTEEMVEDLCGKNNVGMTIIYRRKFMRKVAELPRQSIAKQSELRPKKTFESFICRALGGDRMFSGEGPAVEALSARIQSATESIRITKRVQSQMDENVKRAKESVERDFEQLIRALAVRKKQMLRTIDSRHRVNKELLDAQYGNILETAKTLLMTQQMLSPQIRESEYGAERDEDVMQQVEVCFEECDKHTPADYHYVTKVDFQYESGDSKLLQDYGALRFNGEQLV